jgi:hypothetical protein
MAAMQLQRKVLILGLIAGALALAYALGLVFSPTNVQKRRSEAPLLPAFKPESVANILVDGAEGSSARLAKSDKGWSVLIAGAGYPASAERIQSFFDHLQSLRRSRVVSANPETWKSFGVGDDARTRIRLADAADQTIVSLIVGSSEEGERGSFVRLEAANEVLLLNKSLNFYLDAASSFWSHLRFFTAELQGADIMRISVRAGLAFADKTERRLAYTLIRTQEGGLSWKVVEPAARQSLELENTEVDRVATTLAGFEGAEFIPGPAAAGLASPAAEILFSTTDNKDYRILIGNRSGEDLFYAKVDGGNYVYLAQEWRVKQVTQPLEQLSSQKETVSK